MTKEEFIVALHKTGAIKFGSFVLKSGITSPFYINLRDIISYPDIFRGVIELIVNELPGNLRIDRISGVPYSGLPLASALAIKLNKPLIIKRKEEKAYGSMDSIIGSFNKNDQCLLIEDLITTGESILETKDAFEQEGVKVDNVVVIIDRSSDGGEGLKKLGINLYKLTTIHEIVSVLRAKDLIDSSKEDEIKNFLLKSSKSDKEKHSHSGNPLTRELSGLMVEKKSNLILSVDVETSSEFFSIIEKTGDKIAMLKTHVDILKDFSPEFLIKLKQAADNYGFMLFEDRKFADIGNTVQMQYRGGIYHIADWAEFVTVHLIAGESILKGLFNGIENRSSFLLAKMSSKDNLISENYTRKVIEIWSRNINVVSGFIGHGKNEDEIAKLRRKIPAGLLLLMPGVQLEYKTDTLGQTYITPDSAIRGGADAIIVGRGITHSADPTASADRYREIAWSTFEKRNEITNQS